MKYTRHIVGIISIAALLPFFAAAQSGASGSTITGTVSPHCVTLTRNLAYGAGARSDLASLQLFLYSRGYFSAPITGPFGPMTRAAVIHFQRDNGLPSTGFVGALTRALLSRSCTNSGAVSIQSENPMQGTVGTSVTLTGSGFTTDNTVHFGYGVVPHVAAVGNTITFTVPASLDPACRFSTPRCMVASQMTTPGSYTVTVENKNGTSNALTFTVTDGSTNTNAPVIYKITPTSGPVGTTVTIEGRNFSATNAIRFGNGAIMNVPIGSSIAIACTTDPSCIPGIHQTLTFTVPDGIGAYCPSGSMCPMWFQKVTPGVYPIAVQTDAGTSASIPFTVTSGSTNTGTSITSVSPTSAAYGQIVTITGTGFTQSAVLHFFKDGQPYGTMGGLTVVNNSTITFSVPQWTGVYCHLDAVCIQLAKELPTGAYTIAVEDQNGTTNQVSFTVGMQSSGPLSITGIDAPSSIPMGTTGTWTVHATAPSTTSQLHYSVNWGDTYQSNAGIMAPQTTTVQSSATFSHSFSGAGTYTPTFTVFDDYGHSAMVSATVTVTPWY